VGEIEDFAAGSYHCLLVTKDGKLVVWGRTTERAIGCQEQVEDTEGCHPCLLELPDGEIPWRVACGAFFSLIFAKSGAAFFYGDHNNVLAASTGPEKITIPSSSPVKEVGCGWEHVAVLLEDGSLYVWGANTVGQLGLGDNQNRKTPTLHPLSSSVCIEQICCGENQTLVRSTEGALYSWGDNTPDNPGNTPLLLFEDGVKGMAAGCRSALVLKDDGSIYSWGGNAYGQLGHGDQGERSSPEKLSWCPQRKIAYLGACYYHSWAIAEDGSLFTWGQGTEGQMGTAVYQNFTKPVLVPDIKFYLPQSEEMWKEARWLFLGRIDDSCNLKDIPIEVIFHFCTVRMM
jgi:alpha-tubulin suppressor-like RCC1 family protein